MDLSRLAGPRGWAKRLQALGFSDEDLASGDKRDRWITETKQVGALLAALTPLQVARACTIWPGLEIEILLGTQVQLKLDRTSSSMQQLASLSPTIMYTVRLTLDKNAVLGALGASTNDVRWYVSPQAQRALLEKPQPGIEKDWFGASGTALVVLPDSDVKLCGPFLTVVGGHGLRDVVSPSPSLEDESMFDRQAEWKRNGVWEDDGFAYAVPIQLEVTGDGWKTGIGRLLAEMSARQVMLFTADRLRRSPTVGTVRGEYNGSAGVVAAQMPSGSASDPEGTAKHAHELMRWVFASEPDRRSWLNDRVALLRTVAFEQLKRSSDDGRSQILLDGLDRLSADTMWHWKVFIEGELAGHVAAVDEYRREVVDAVDAFASTTSDLVDSTIDGMKAAVATALGSFIGAALATDFKEVVFRAGMGLYAIYIVTFPGALGLWSKYDRFTAADQAFVAARSRASGALGEGQLERVEGGRTARARRSFWLALGASALIFLLVAIGALIAQRTIPGLLR